MPGPKSSNVLPKATAFVHSLLGSVLRPGDHVVDATCGNGHDTVALARMIGPEGRVLAIDLQEQAVASTLARARESGCEKQVHGVVGSHAGLAGHWRDRFGADPACPGPPIRAMAVVFNLGYLPGGDKSRVTRPESTLPALQDALAILAPGGLLVATCDPGHPGGAEETEAVRGWFAALPPDSHPAAEYGFLNQPARPPRVFACSPR